MVRQRSLTPDRQPSTHAHQKKLITDNPKAMKQSARTKIVRQKTKHIKTVARSRNTKNKTKLICKEIALNTLNRVDKQATGGKTNRISNLTYIINVRKSTVSRPYTKQQRKKGKKGRNSRQTTLKEMHKPTT